MNQSFSQAAKTTLVLSILIPLSSILAAPILPATEPPVWVAHGVDAAYPQNEYIAVEGRGKNKKTAEADALAALSRYFETRVETTTRISETSVVQNNAENYLGIFESGTFEQSAANLFAVRYAPSYYDKAAKTYTTVAYIERDEAWRIFEPRVRREADAFRALWRNAESETEPLKSFFDYKAADNFSRRAEFIGTMDFGRILYPSKMSALTRDVDEAKAELPAKLNTARNMAGIFIDINTDYESNVTGALTKLFSGEGLHIATNKKTAQAICQVIIDEGFQRQEGTGDFYYPKITVVINGKNGVPLFSYSASPGKQAAMDAKVAKRRAYSALASALEHNFLAELNKGLSVK